MEDDFDMFRTEAKEKLIEAASLLRKCLDPKTRGFDSYLTEYKQDLQKCLKRIDKIIQNL